MADAKVIQELYDYALWIASLRRREPKEDVLTVLVNTKIADGSYISDETRHPAVGFGIFSIQDQEPLEPRANPLRATKGGRIRAEVIVER
jgi:hypothetical protein